MDVNHRVNIHDLFVDISVICGSLNLSLKMKNWLLICAISAVAAGVFFSCSSKPPVKKVIGIHTPMSGIDRCLMDTSAWKRWWPASSSGYRIEGVFYHEVRIRLLSGGGDQP